MVLTVSVDAEGVGDAIWKVPAGKRGPDLAPRLPMGCEPTGIATIERPAGAVVQRTPIRCARLDGDRIAVVGLSGTSSQVFVRVTREGGSIVTGWLNAATPEFTIPPSQTVVDEIRRYLFLGLGHLVGGVDHQLFVVGLLLLIGWRRRLVSAVSAFTFGHSLTLAAGYLGWVAIGEAWVEVGIALTIVTLAAQLGEPEEHPPLLTRRPALMAGLFGLLHGLGFASVLDEVGLPPNHWVEALFAFNVGIEMGQMAGILMIFAASRLVVKTFPAMQRMEVRRLRSLAGYALGATAAYWTMERTLAAVLY